MNSKIAVCLITLLISFSSSCKKDNYEGLVLEDTWGEDGNWGPESKKNDIPKLEKKIKVVEKEKPKIEKKSLPVKKEVVAEKPKVKVTDKREPVLEKEDKKTFKLSFDSSKYNYSIKETKGWKQESSLGPIKANFVKENSGNKLNFSIGIVRNLKESQINDSFKKSYVEKLKNRISGLRNINENSSDFKGQKAWQISYSFLKNGENYQQKQTFLTHKNNTLIVNMLSTEDGFFTGEKDFDSIKNNLVLN